MSGLDRAPTSVPDEVFDQHAAARLANRCRNLGRPTKREQGESLFQNDNVALVCLEMQSGRMPSIHYGVTNRQTIALISTVFPELRHQIPRIAILPRPCSQRGAALLDEP